MDNDRSQEVLQYLKKFCKEHEKKKLPKINEIASHFSMSEYEVGKWMRILISQKFLTLKYNHWGFSKEIWDELFEAPKQEQTPIAVQQPTPPEIKKEGNKFTQFVEKILHNDKRSQYVIFVGALSISCFLVGQMGWAISSKPLTKLICLIIFTFVELLGQFCLGRGKFYREKKSRKQWLYFIAFAIYILIFSIPASVGFFNSELSTQTAEITRVDGKINRIESRLSQISKALILQDAFLAYETNTGYGSRVKAILSNIDALTGEQAGLNSALNTAGHIPAEESRAVYFITLSKALWGLPEELIKVLMFSVAMALLVFAMVVTCPVFRAKE